MSARVIDRPHSRAKYVVEKCRCDVCRAANNAAQRRYQRRQAAEQWGMPPVLVDAEPVRRHVRALMAGGVGWQRIARLSGVPSGAVSRLLYGSTERGPSRRVRPNTASRLLALRVDQAADGARIDATGTRRRLQALVALGWSGSELMRRLDREPTNFGFLVERDRVEARTARAVQQLYDEMWNQAPPADDRWQRTSVSRARNYARAQGWLPPMAWDDDQIDDPHAEPFADQDDGGVDEVAVERCLSERPVGRPLTRSERLLVAARARERGDGVTRVAALLQCSGKTAHYWLTKAAQDATETTTAVPA